MASTNSGPILADCTAASPPRECQGMRGGIPNQSPGNPLNITTAHSHNLNETSICNSHNYSPTFINCQFPSSPISPVEPRSGLVLPVTQVDRHPTTVRNELRPLLPHDSGLAAVPVGGDGDRPVSSHAPSLDSQLSNSRLLPVTVLQHFWTCLSLAAVVLICIGIYHVLRWCGQVTTVQQT